VAFVTTVGGIRQALPTQAQLGPPAFPGAVCRPHTPAAYPTAWHITLVAISLDRPPRSFLDGKFTKWNSNFGTVHRSAMGGIQEEDEEDEDDYPSAMLRPKVDDVPQAFSHFTHFSSGGKHLVCDIQGTFSAIRDPEFNLVDPVIHSDEGEKARFGRTDRGAQGIADFFKSHQCNGLCKLLRLPHNHEFVAPAFSGFDTSRSMNTSEITVVKTNHLAQRQAERVIQTRELQSAVKHGDKISTPGGRLIHRAADVEYITDATGRIGITSYRPTKFVPNLR